MHLQALKGRGAFSATALVGFTHELSGELSSLKPDLAEITNAATAQVAAMKQTFIDRGQRAPSKFAFVGVACASAAELQLPVGTIPTDVIYTPQNGNDAHADFVTRVATDGELDEVKAELTRRLRLIPNDKLDQLQDCAVGAVASTPQTSVPSVSSS